MVLVGLLTVVVGESVPEPAVDVLAAVGLESLVALRAGPHRDAGSFHAGVSSPRALALATAWFLF
jgi:hypothetical protein